MEKKISKLIMTVAVMAALAFGAGNAFAISNNSSVVSPYWQADGGTYTFIGISHPSLSGMASQIGLTITALTEGASSPAAVDGPVTFTITSGSTQKVFIVTTNATGSPVGLSGAQYITFQTTNPVSGAIRIAPIATVVQNRAGSGNFDKGFEDVTMLTMWGAIVIQATASGFAMEFVGDLHDSHVMVRAGSASGAGQIPASGVF